jgi:activator of 2-hydroxyglutaryl-CoA dehydratase
VRAPGLPARRQLGVCRTSRRKPKEALRAYLSRQRPDRFDRIALTGRRLKDLVRLSTITEPEAVETATRHQRCQDSYEAVVSAGGETFLLYKLDSRKGISSVVSGNKCASGTGEFFLQQIKRMGLQVDEAVRLAESSTAYKVSGRCSVFCKSDCTHALNRGEPIGDVCAGLCLMMAEKILELTSRTGVQRILLVGGTTRNHVMVEELRRRLQTVVVPEQAVHFEALGAAMWALKHQTEPFPGPEQLFVHSPGSFGVLPFLAESAERVVFHSLPQAEDYRQIAALALRAERPPNFSDQCAAFINSDIKTALQEGTGVDDIMAGLVYSICTNYLNKVKGARSFGKTIFMQGGVCYNRAVPIAMASLLGRRIVVPPHPGLMGAFGVALEVRQRLQLGMLEPQAFCLRELADRTVSQVGSFVCRGGKERCDRNCPIRIIEVAGERHPFGGACNRYYNRRMRKTRNAGDLNLVRRRQHMVFRETCPPGGDRARSVGINRSFLTHTYYPLFYSFFARLGLRVILSSEVRPEGLDRKGSAFCYPCDISHGMFADLLAHRLLLPGQANFAIFRE